MKKISLIKPVFAFIFILSLSSVYAQGGGGRYQHRQDRQKIETQKIAFITDRLDLSVEEAEKFWPVYNQHQDAMDAERKSFREANNLSAEKIDAMTDDQAREKINSIKEHEQKVHKMRSAYLNNLKPVLSPQKILKLMQAEKDFREELVRRVSKGRGQGRSQQGRSPQGNPPQGNAQ